MESTEMAELLREIRDLQQAHLDQYTEALRRQEAAIEQQREAVAVARKASQLYRRALWVILALVIAILVALSLTVIRL